MSTSNPSHSKILPGQLLYNGLYRTSAHSNLGTTGLTQNIPSYTRKDYPDQGRGQLSHPAINDLSKAILNLSTASFSNAIQGFRYQKDKWKIRDVSINGSMQQYPSLHLQVLDVYWISPNYLLFQGPKAVVQTDADYILDRLPKPFDPDEIDFDRDFFLWIMYQLINKDPIGGSLSLRRLRECSTVDPNKPDSNQTRVQNKTGVDQTPELLVSLSDGNVINSLKGDFVVDGSYVVAEIVSEGIIRVRSSKSSLNKLDPVRQLAYSILLTRELLRAYDAWRQLPGKEKYPADVYSTIQDECANLGFDPIFPPTSRIQSHQAKQATSNSP
jgi:hypothetical protein